MKNCLNCGYEFQEKKDSAKYCSVSCRVMYNRKNPKDRVSKVQMQDLYNSVKELIEAAKNNPPAPQYAALTNKGMEYGSTPVTATIVLEMTYNQAQDELRACCSGPEIEKVWRKISAKKNWAGWQLRELTKIKEDQRTKIDF